METKHNGFSMIELMIVVAIVGVIAMIAYPAYTDYVTEAKRGQGQAVLLDAQLKQERYRSYNNEYATTAASLAAANLELATHDFYTLAVSEATASTFTLTATATGTQATNDADCTPLTINQNNEKGPSNACWQD